MSVPIWQAGRLYQTGALVRPASSALVGTGQPGNPDFELGDVDWTKSTGWTISEAPLESYTGTWRARFDWAGVGESDMPNEENLPCSVGQTITVGCFVRAIGTGGGSVGIQWLDSLGAPLSPPVSSYGNMVIGVAAFGGSQYKSSTLTAVAPVGAALFRLVSHAIAFDVMAPSGALFDNFTTSYAYVPNTSPFIFKAVQPSAGTSGSSEPTWPQVLGEQVIDNEVIWEAVNGTTVTWTAFPMLTSCPTEPVWPTQPGASVADCSISWVAESQRITDPRCPNSKIVVIGSSKIFAADQDIIPFSATVNPMDWSTRNNAGYLPFGLQSYGSMPVSAMGLYRSNLVAFNAQGFQMWQIDEDPTNMALLDAVPIGCTHHQSLQPVMNDLVFLSSVGIRNMGVAGAASNLQAGDFGKQVDEVVQELIEARPNAVPLGLYYPGMGQYWLIIGNQALVLTINGDIQSKSWSRYVFPWDIDYWTILTDELYLRAGDLVVKLDDAAIFDQQIDNMGVPSGIPFDGIVQWPYLDFGNMGPDKMMAGFDMVGKGEVTIEVGFSQQDPTLFTTPFTIPSADTLNGQVVPLPVMGPSFSFKLTYSGAQTWSWNASTIYMDDTGTPG